MCSRVPALPPHVNISFIGIRPRWDQNLEFCIFALGNIQLLTIWGGTHTYGFSFESRYVVAMCALPEYLLALFYYQISQGMICFVFFFFWAPAIIVKQISSQEKAVGWVPSTPCHHGVILIRISRRTRRGEGQVGTSHPTKTPTWVPCLLFPWFDCTISTFED